jgi:hypothetical protein
MDGDQLLTLQITQKTEHLFRSIGRVEFDCGECCHLSDPFTMSFENPLF